MINPETASDVKKIGSVEWGFQYSGYISGLPKLEDRFLGEMRIYWFAREVAIAVSKPQACQQDPRKIAGELLEASVLTEDEIQYVYQQFGFDPKSFSY